MTVPWTMFHYLTVTAAIGNFGFSQRMTVCDIVIQNEM